MTAVADGVEMALATRDVDGPQRFVFGHVDWAFYQDVRQRVNGRRAFVTYYKGRLEVVTISFLHEWVTGILATLVREMAVATGQPLCGAGSTTLDRQDLDDGTQADASFYTVHAAQMIGKTQLDLTVDPPPDLAIEVEVTHRLGQRRQIYQDLGVPEVWVWNASGLTFLLRRPDGTYAAADRSPTFPILSAAELHAFVANRTAQDDTAIVIAFRERLREVMDGPPQQQP